jgi:hypothetical protein
MQLLDRFKKALAGEGGEALVLQIEREAADKAEFAADRKRLDAEIRESERRRKEELPKLREKAAALRAEVDRVREELLAAEGAVSKAAGEEWDLDWTLRGGIERARLALERTAWPWLHQAIEDAKERRRHWQNYGWERHRWFRSEKVPVEPDPSDPDYRLMKRRGGTYWMQRFGSNKAAMNAVNEAMNKALESLERLRWRVDEPTRDEVAVLMKAFEERTWAEAAKEVVWIEPKAPRYDKDGEPIAA